MQWNLQYGFNDNFVLRYIAMQKCYERWGYGDMLFLYFYSLSDQDATYSAPCAPLF